MAKIYAFDVDHTLNCSNGPVDFADLVNLRKEGHIVGLCGNWSLALNFLGPSWGSHVSFIGSMEMTKRAFLSQIRNFTPQMEDYVFVGNDPTIFGLSNDKEDAAAAGWRFLREYDFASGMR